MSTRWGKSAIVVVVVISNLVEKKKCFSFFLLCSFLRHLALGSKKRKNKRVNADIVLKCGCDRSVRILYIFLPKRKRKKKVKVKYKQEVKELMWPFCFFLFRGVISVKGVQLQTSTHRSAASDGFSGIWSLRERIVAFLGYCRRRMRDSFSL